jgi:predicted permease
VFEAQDRADGLPVVIINQAMADRLWPNMDPVGTRISFQGQDGPWFEVIGMVGSTRIAAADESPAPALYMSFSQKPWTWLGWQTLLARIGPGQDPLRLVPAIQAALWDLDDRVPVQRVATVEQLYGEGSAQRRFAAQLVGVFAVLALILGTVGIYGVLSYTVSQRRQEIGIRMALGAGRSEVMKTILRQGMLLTVIGVVIGGVAAFFTTRIMASLLYEVSPTDPVTFASVTLLLGGAALLAAWLPARRATRVDPVVVMREI